MSTPKKIRKTARTATALSLAALIGMTTAITPGIAATETETASSNVSVVGLGYEEQGPQIASFTNINPNLPREIIKQGDSLDLTDAELVTLSDKANGIMTGTVSLSADPEQLEQLRALGINLDLEKSETITNHALSLRSGAEEGGPWTKYYEGYRGSDQLLLSLDYDTAVAEELAVSHELSNPVLRMTGYRDGFKRTHANISTAAQWGVPDIKAGDNLTEKGPATPLLARGTFDVIYDGNDNYYEIMDHGKGVGTPVASLYPVVGYVDGGAGYDGGSNQVSLIPTTTFIDPYSDGDSAARRADLAASGSALPTNVDNCLVDSCSVWLTPTISGTDPNTWGRPQTIALASPIEIKVHTTVSAGMAPTAESFETESGKTVQFKPRTDYPVCANLEGVDFYYFTTEVLPFFQSVDYDSTAPKSPRLCDTSGGGGMYGAPGWSHNIAGYDLHSTAAPAEAPQPAPVPEANPDVATVRSGMTARITVMSNDLVSEGFEMVPGSLHLMDPEEELVKQLSVPEMGDFEVVDDEHVDFTAAEDSSGTVEVAYQWEQTDGETTVSASSTIQVSIEETPAEVAPEVPVEVVPEVPVEVVPEVPVEVVPEVPVEETPETPETPEAPEVPVKDIPVEKVANAGFSGAGLLAGMLASLVGSLAAIAGWRTRKTVR